MRVVGAEDVVAGLGIVLFHRGSVALAGLAQVVGCCAITVGVGFARAGEAVRAQAGLLVGDYRSGGCWLGCMVNSEGGRATYGRGGGRIRLRLRLLHPRYYGDGWLSRD